MFSSCKQNEQEGSRIQTVKVDTVRVYGQSKSVTFPGKVVAASDLNLSFRISGPIAQVHVDAGSYVRKGQLLAEIDARDYRVQLSATEAEYSRIKAEAERIIALYEKGSVSPNDYDKAVYGLNQITAKQEAHRHALADTKLTAPCDGYIQKRLFEPGEMVSAGLPILSMVSQGRDEVEINIPSSDYVRRDRFDRYACAVDLYPGKSFPLEPIGITHKANMNQLYRMRFRLVGNDPDKPGPGMSTMVTIHYREEQSDRVTIPLSAIFESDNAVKVWLYNSNTETLSSREVKIAEIGTDGRAVISSGLKAGEVVVSSGVHSVKEGQRVRLLPAQSPTNIGGML